MRLVYDLETNGLLDTVDTLWCIGTVDLDTGEERLFDPSELKEGLEYLSNAELLVAHNGVRYDNEVLKKLYGIDLFDKTLDTMLMAKINSPFLTKIKGVTNKPYSLQAFGHRFKFPKGDYDDWSHYSTDMGEYCLQDCRVTRKIWQWLDKRGYEFFSDWNKIEHEFAQLQQKAVNRGVWFDKDLQMKTIAEINTRMTEIQDSVSDVLGYSYVNFDYNTKKDKTLSHYAVKKLKQIKLEYPDYNIPVKYNKDSSRCRIKQPVKITLDTKKTLITKLQELGWNPVFYTDPSDTYPDGQPQLVRDGEVDPNLAEMGDEYKEFSEYFMLKHRYSLITGFSRLLRPDGRIGADGDTVGAVTGRVTHRGIANFPRVSTLYGEVIRAMFGVDIGRIQLGSDLAGIEARMLAHFMNDDEFSEFISGKDENGEDNDVHTFNKEKVGLDTRDAAKTFYYALLYGAGAKKIGALVGGGSKEGEQVKKDYFEMFPGLKATMERMEKEGNEGYVRIIGDRPVRLTRSEGYDGEMQYDVRKALNSLLQGSAAMYFKKWAIEVDKRLKGNDTIVILYHDEVQIDAEPSNEEYIRKALDEAVIATDMYFDVNCPNAVDTKSGLNWRDCH